MTALYVTKCASVLPRRDVHFLPSGKSVPVFAVPEEKITPFLPTDIDPRLDRVTKLALASAAKVKQSLTLDPEFFTDSLACIVGSARGATATLESSIVEYSTKGTARTLTSPLTTAGGIASSIANLWETPPLSVGTSMACASFLEALLIGESFIKSKRCKRVLVVGAEAPLTDFTIAQMQALKLYSSLETDSPCQPLAATPLAKNTLVLGEGASCILLEGEESLHETKHTPLLELLSFGFIQERNVSLTGIDPEGKSFFLSMKQALNEMKNFPSAIFTHAPGTSAGDAAEYEAMMQLGKQYGVDQVPVFCSKALFGHTFGASSALSLACAVDAITSKNQIFNDAYPLRPGLKMPSLSGKEQSILINAAGFGGVVGSILLRTV